MPDAITLRVYGLHCASCVGRAERALLSLPGVQTAAVNLATGMAFVEANEVPRDALAHALEDAGYSAVLEPGREAVSEAEDLKSNVIIAAALTLPVFVVEMGGHLVPAFHHWLQMSFDPFLLKVTQFCLIGLVLIWPGRAFFSIGVPALWRGAPEMNALVALGTGTAFLYSSVATFFPFLLPETARHIYFEAAGVIITLILLGRYLEARAKRAAGLAIEALVALQPKDAVRLEDGKAVTRPLAEIKAGDVLLARPGEAIAVDGIVTDGQSAVNEAMLTGEPFPTEKSAGSVVHAGTINGDKALTYRATGVGTDTTLARIIDMVHRAQAAKLPVQAKLDQIIAVFVPVIMGLAVVSFLGWIFFTGNVTQALIAVVSVLIIACPCAMGLATPVSITVAMGRAAELGLLYRGGEGLERLAGVRTIAFDKTGTVTQGSPRVVASYIDDGIGTLAEIAAVEAQSSHPLAQAILAGFDGIPQTASDVVAVPGKGVTAQVNGAEIAVGSLQFMHDLQADMTALAEPSRDVAASGRSMVYAAKDNTVFAIFAIEDPIKDDAKETFGVLSQTGQHMTMISGDSTSVLAKVAKDLGLQSYHGDVLPADKLALIESLQRAGRVAFVGDGINDAPALAQADVGIAMGTGTDVAIETADVVIMSDKLMQVDRAVRLSKATMRNIYQNLFWAFGYNAALVPVAMGVFYPVFGWQLSPMLGAAAMALSSIFVVTNALRLKRFA